MMTMWGQVSGPESSQEDVDTEDVDTNEVEDTVDDAENPEDDVEDTEEDSDEDSNEDDEPAEDDDPAEESEESELGSPDFLEDLITDLEGENQLLLDSEEVYEPTKKGVAKLIKDHNAKVTEYYNNELAKQAKAIRAEYDSGESYSDMDISDESTAKKLLEDYYKATGLEGDEIEDKIEAVTDNNRLTKEANIAKRYLTKQEKATKENAVKAEAKAEQDRIDADNKNREDYRRSIESTEQIAGFKVEPAERKKFAKYMTEVGKDGLTGFMRAASSADAQRDLAYLLYKGIDAKYVDTKAISKVSKEVKKKVSRFATSKAKPGKTIKKQSNAAPGKVPAFFQRGAIEIED